jgi:hypothetical protein
LLLRVLKEVMSLLNCAGMDKRGTIGWHQASHKRFRSNCPTLPMSRTHDRALAEPSKAISMYPRGQMNCASLRSWATWERSGHMF